MMEIISDCRSKDGIDIGLIDSIIISARLLKERKLNREFAVINALADLFFDGDVCWLMEQANDAAKIVNK